MNSRFETEYLLTLQLVFNRKFKIFYPGEFYLPKPEIFLVNHPASSDQHPDSKYSSN
jgi:hypothetical protein